MRMHNYFTSKNLMFPFSIELKEKCSQRSTVTSELKIPSCRHISRYLDIFHGYRNDKFRMNVQLSALSLEFSILHLHLMTIVLR